MGRLALGLGLPRRPGLPVGPGRALLEEGHRPRRQQRGQAGHGDAPAPARLQPRHPRAAHRRHGRGLPRHGDGPLPPVLAGHRPDPDHPPLRRPRLHLRGQGHEDLRGEPAQERLPQQPVAPCRGPGQGRLHRPLQRQRLPARPQLRVRRRRPRARHGVLGPVAVRPERRQPLRRSQHRARGPAHGPHRGPRLRRRLAQEGRRSRGHRLRAARAPEPPPTRSPPLRQAAPRSRRDQERHRQ